MKELANNTLANSAPRLSTIELNKEALNFSIAHFTIFNATEREDLHGHNYQLECKATAPLADTGLLFDYAILKKMLRAMCDEIDEKMILPSQSPHLKIEHGNDYTYGIFNGERIPFLPRDLIILPIANSTVEELSHYFLDRVLNHPDLADAGIVELNIKILSSPGQGASAHWSQN